jgi:hypothetical protein
MSAAAARRRKQLATRAAGQAGHDIVADKLQQTLQAGDTMDETTAYEALQLAQSLIRKRIQQGHYESACTLCSETSLALLERNRVSVASQLLHLLAEILRETHTADTAEWMERIQALQAAHVKAMTVLFPDAAKDSSSSTPTSAQVEALRLARLQRDWLRDMTHWSSDLGTVRYGQNILHELFAQQSYQLATLWIPKSETTEKTAISKGTDKAEDDEDDDRIEAWCDAVQHMALAERPDQIVAWLATLPAPTSDETSLGHKGPPALRDSLLTRTVLLLVAMDNLRDASALIRGYINQVEEPSGRLPEDLRKSYTSKDDGKAPSHVIFCGMLVRICEKDAQVGPLFTWLLRSFKKELEKMHKPQIVLGYTTKIGQKYFNIQPPPSMMNMVSFALLCFVCM